VSRSHRAAYLDHAATTPLRTAAYEALLAELGRHGNASSLHTAGRRARRVVEEAREAIAAAVGAGPSEVVLTGGGTEADNLAVKGLFWARQSDRPRPRVLVSAVEHHAVLDPADWLQAQCGAEVVRVPVDEVARVDVEALRSLVAQAPDDVAVVSVMWANNEVGTLQPVAEVVSALHGTGIPVHCDAVQAVGQVGVDFGASGLHAMTVSAHKVGGPVGAGALVARKGLDLTPVIHGGGQERGVRSGTLDVAAARAFAVAVTEAVEELPGSAKRLTELRNDLVSGVLAAVPDAVLRGDTDSAGRLPGNAHFTFPGCEGDSLLYLLDARGVECSTGSACQAGVPQPSHVLRSMGVREDDARGALRFSLGHTSTAGDVAALVDVIGSVVERARRAGLASRRAEAGRA
jgi:cysteine desulfurase